MPIAIPGAMVAIIGTVVVVMGAGSVVTPVTPVVTPPVTPPTPEIEISNMKDVYHVIGSFLQNMLRISNIHSFCLLFKFQLLTSSAGGSSCDQLKEIRSKVSNVRSHPGRLRSKGGHKVEGIGDVIKHGRGVRELDQAGHSK